MGDKGENAEVSEDIAYLKDPSGLMQGEGGRVDLSPKMWKNSTTYLKTGAAAL